MSLVISVEHLSKAYQIGVVGSGTLWRDVERWWAKIRCQPDPFLKIGQAEVPGNGTRDVWALRDVSFDVPQGERVGIIGKNGTGKSTLLKILSKVTSPTLGKVKIRGLVASLLEVGTGFHPELTGRENILMNGAIHGMARQEMARKMDEIVEFSGVGQYLDTPVKRYSSGMYVRLAFSVAAHLDPDILVIDEVLAVGDYEFQKKCLGKMEDVSGKGGRTVLFVSHNMDSIKRFCTQCILLSHGQIAHIGQTEEVVQKYLATQIVDLTSHRFFPEQPSLEIQLLEAALLNSEKRPFPGVIDLSEPVFLEFTVAIRKEMEKMYACFIIYNQQDVPAAFFDIRDQFPDFGRMERGIWRFHTRIPNPFLSPGKYQMMIKVMNCQNGERDIAQNCLSFEIADKKNYRGFSRPGMVFFPLNWEFSNIFPNPQLPPLPKP
jgi:lipopolysaccharide transport system ATP-binding protein